MDKEALATETQKSDMVIPEKRGYLNTDFRIFHVKDRKSMDFQYHHHDFHKIIIFISGRVTYHIEGKAYNLKPWDIVLVPNTKIHRPVIDENEIYERIVLWFYPEFLERYSSEKSNLLQCFNIACEKDYYIIRQEEEKLFELKKLLIALENSQVSNLFGSDILKNALFIESIISISRLFMQKENFEPARGNSHNDIISNIIKYINDRLTDELTIDDIAAKFYTSRYYIMHKFKEETGSTIYSYILQKRLVLAKTLIRKGLSMKVVAEQSGFNDYSTFVRAFKKSFYVSPREYIKQEENDGLIGNLDI